LLLTKAKKIECLLNNLMSSRSIRESHLGFLQVPHPGSVRATSNRNYNLTDEIFLRSVNQSHIGYMSGQKQELKEIEMEEILPPV
jgi:hypothetical protein